MGNLFCSEYRIHRRFDLKGSSHGRTTDKLKGDIDENTTLKDLDLDYVFRLQTNWYQELIKLVWHIFFFFSTLLHFFKFALSKILCFEFPDKLIAIVNSLRQNE